MRRPVLVIAPLAAALLVAVAPSGAASARVPGDAKCDTKRQTHTVVGTKRTRLKRFIPFRTVAGNDEVRVYRTTRNHVEDRYYVCSQATGRARFVGRDPHDSGAATTDRGLDNISVRSTSQGSQTYVALRMWSRGDVNFDQFVVVSRSGAKVHDTGRLTLPGEFAANDLPALALTPSGAFAYAHAGTLTAVDAAGTRVLAIPAGGPITSVAAEGQVVYWTQGGVARSAPLA